MSDLCLFSFHLTISSTGPSLTLFSWIPSPAWSPSRANVALGTPGTWWALGPWYTGFPRGPHWLLNGSWLPTYLVNEHVELQHLL